MEETRSRKSTRDLVCEVLERWETEGEQAVEAVCRANPDGASMIRGRIEWFPELLPERQRATPDRPEDPGG